MERRLRNRNINSVNGIDSQRESDVALGRGRDVVSQVVIQRNLRQIQTNTNQTLNTEPTISSDGNLHDLFHPGPNEQPSDRSTETENEMRSNRRNKWTKEEYVGIIEAYYQAVETKHPGGMMAGMYAIWREKYPSIHTEMNAVKLNNQRNYIIRSNKLTTYEMESIRRRICDGIRNNAYQMEEEVASDQNTHNQIARQNPIHMSIQEGQAENNPNNEQIEFETKLREKIAEVSCIPISERKTINKIRQCRSTEEQIKIANEAIKKIIEGRNQNLTELNNVLYATAALIAGEKEVNVGTSRNANGNEPIWCKRINQQVKTFREHISILSEYRKNNGTVSTKVSKKLRRIMNNTPITMDNVTTFEQIIKMKLQAKVQRLRRYKKRRLQYVQNKMFDENRTKLYRQLNNKETQVTDTPKKEEVEYFWRSILENQQQHRDAEWINRIKSCNNQIPQQNWTSIDDKNLKILIGKLHNWKAPGPDKVQNFWIKKLTSLHHNLAHAYNRMMDNLEDIPEWLTEG